MERTHLLSLFSDFLSGIGIELIEREIKGTVFLPGLTVENGKLVMDEKKLLYPGDILHEAGHIAVTRAEERKLITGNIMEGRPGNEGEEMAAMLWSYAACLHLRIDPQVVFHEEGYKGQSEWLLDNYSSGNYIGMPLLVWMQMAAPAEEVNGFPHMLKWMRD